ncbi:DUF3817 domain-containing protein [Solihabitans fulvus]|uniref:DUF3817 domain-containing protein n=1 Tax=Solihabitans fulvus TaxID=1892852 RepID=A0A5B2X8L2_9PSEU|nr:DUF3817 domain-containing protein [Solihabitans fulvus]KAA2259486.1 DUF3817 domain-containing protein [Solihabitans fulvus]
MFSSPGSRFRFVAMAEAVSWAGLLVGMLFKHVIGSGDVGVKIFGPIHGVVFVCYVLVALLVREPLGWDGRTTRLALLASIPPFGSVFFERWAARTGRLEVVAEARVTQD